MAKTNKYTSINFNDLYDKKFSSSTSTSTSKQHPFSSSIAANKSGYLSAASRSHGMLVLSRPSLNPQPSFQSPSLPTISPLKAPPQPPPERDSISLRPLGNTGSEIDARKKEPIVAPTVITMPKSDKFVPPHLRPGFVAKEERPGSSGGLVSGSSSPIPYGEDRRPKSGGGYGRRLEYGGLNRPRSGGNRPNSSG